MIVSSVYEPKSVKNAGNKKEIEKMICDVFNSIISAESDK